MTEKFVFGEPLGKEAGTNGNHIISSNLTFDVAKEPRKFRFVGAGKNVSRKCCAGAQAGLL